jgi:hypothetical protein
MRINTVGSASIATGIRQNIKNYDGKKRGLPEEAALFFVSVSEFPKPIRHRAKPH